MRHLRMLSLALTLFGLVGVAGWLTHIVWMVNLLSSAAPAPLAVVIFSVVGTIVPCVGAIHGIIRWIA